MMKHIRKPGQAMVEFALILPLLLLIIVGIFEFGRVMFIYSNLFNAAREGARYGVTNPRDYAGIETHATDKVSLVNTADVTFQLVVEYDTGPGTATFVDQDAVVAGNRVLVSIQYDLIPMTPLLLPIVAKFPLDTQAARTIQTIGTIINPPPPPPPPPPPSDPSISLSPNCGPTGDDQTITISGSNWTEDTRVDVYFDGGLVLSNQAIESSFTLSFNVNVTSGDHTVRVVGLNSSKVATATYTSPCTGPPPPDPSISLSPTCGPVGNQTIVVSGSDWPGDYRVDVYFDGAQVLKNKAIGSSFTLSFSVDVTSGDHTVLVRDRASPPREATATFTSPCAASPDPSISLSPTCGPPGNQTIAVSGSDWTGDTLVDVYFGGGLVLGNQSIGSSFTLSFNVDVTEGNHTVRVRGQTTLKEATATFTSPCSGPPPTPVPIIISDPVLDGNTVVSGTAETGQTVTLRVVQTGYQKSVVVGPGNHFEFTGVPALVTGYTIIVQGYGEQDTALVQGGTSTPTPTPTPLPTTPYLVINSPDPACGPISSTTPIDISISGFNFTDDYYVTISFDGVDEVIDIGKIDPEWGPETFSVSDLSAETHVIRAEAYSQKGRGGTKGNDVTIDFLSPCSTPDLIVTGLTLLDTLPLTTYQKINVEVCVANQGGADVPSLFWVDLFADTAPDPLTFPSVDYVAVNGLPAGASISFTMWVEAGFPVTGTHTLIALADTWDQISEANEVNNPSAPLSIILDVAGPAPTPTPTPSVTPGAPGTIQGVTYLDGVPQSLVDIYVYDLYGRLVWSGKSQTIAGPPLIIGYYEADLPPGDYTITAQMRMADKLYRGQTVVTGLTSGEIRTMVDISLTSIE